MDYSPLAKGQFRLVTVHPRFSSIEGTTREELPLRCTLQHVSRSENHAYQALSYAWGNPQDRLPLQVNGKEISVTRNLQFAVQKIRDDNVDVIFWIDALSINQEDSEEKTEQVKYMNDIYKNASSTRVWLGPSDNSSDEAIAKLNHVGDFTVSQGILDLMIQFGTLPPGESARYQTLETAIKNGLSGFFDAALEDLPGTKSFVIAVQELMSRVYWHRVWILQEIVVSSEIRIQCGDSLIFFPQLHGGILYTIFMKTHVCTKLYDRIMQHLEHSPMDDHVKGLQTLLFGIASSQFSSSTTKIFRMRRRYRIPPESSLDASMTLIRILEAMYVTGAAKTSTEATDPRDRIFALLGMARDREKLEKLKLVIDYNKFNSCSSLYPRAAHAIIMSGQVDLLAFAQNRDGQHDIPSWVPDWRAEWILRPSGQTPWDTAFAASGDNAFQIPSDVELLSPQQLKLNGYQVDIIETRGQPWTPHYLDGCSLDPTGVTTSYMLEVAALCDMSDAKVEGAGKDKEGLEIYSNNYDRIQAHVRVPVADQEEYGLSFIQRATQNSHQGYREVIQGVMERIDDILSQDPNSDSKESMQNTRQRINAILNRDRDSETRATQASAGSTQFSAVKSSYFNMLGWQRDRRPFLSEKGYVGLAPCHVERGDVIVIFGGAKFPYVLRGKANKTYDFIGEAYVHGIMYGEFVKQNVDVKSFILE